MRVSDIQAWSNCETMALQSPPRPLGRTNVAAWVGTLAHGWLSGLEPEPPERLAFDGITPTMQNAIVQAGHITSKARALLSEYGWGVLESEEELGRGKLTGHLDLRLWHSDHGEAIVDLKTGQGIGTAWLQVGGYLTLDGGGVDWGGVLHIPRVSIHKDVRGTLALRPSHDIAKAWQVVFNRVSDVLNGAPPMRTPGLHCGRCGITTCPVRI